MILQTLTEYYREQVTMRNPLYAPPGMELKRIHFVLVITTDGTLIDIEEHEQKTFVVKSRERGGKDAPLTANYMWDSLGYVTGYETDEKQIIAATTRHHSFVKEVVNISKRFTDNKTFTAVKSFYSKTGYKEKLYSHHLWEKIASRKGHNLSFRLLGENLIAAQQKELTRLEKPAISRSICLVSGQKAQIQLKHPKIHVPGGAGTGTKLISFTKRCGYDSYYKQNGDNAPISTEAAESYAAALTGLLQHGSGNSVIIDKISIIYYTLPNTDFNALFHTILNPSIKTDRKEIFPQLEKYLHRKEEFVLMAVIPNMARLSVRTFIRTTIGEVTQNILQFYEETEIIHAHRNICAPSVMFPLFVAAPQRSIDKMTPQSVIDYLDAIITAKPFAVTLQHELLNRIREKREPKPLVTALLRCYMNRKNFKYIPMALDKKNSNTGYLLGRAFAILERAQEMSTPRTNFTIRDTYYLAMSITPATVFNRLIGLSSTFFRKISSQGTSVFLKSQLGEVTTMLSGDTIPLRLSLDDQSRFALGYFHQRQTYFIKKEQQDEQHS